ncbi:NAD-dependent epimerase/dehydratase family protein [Patulibacter defluvii]|uniref:NAD-dependent epimerase/dehydratase family protein n=1 Tax=Patulibacter defluvii TaxID=3095358 RepID=UPI002A75A2DC|nr:NAD-dependent epimerase/dehydratase family protein [Patulibacter sp. DM4]
MLLVTGGAGFVGAQIVTALLDRGHAVRVLDALLPAAHGPDRPAAEAAIDPRAELVVGDVADPATVAAALDGVTAVCHQAAMVGLGQGFDDAPDYVRHNDLGTAVLLRALARRGGVERLVLASSMVVYGEGRYRCPAHGTVRPAPRRREDLDGGRFDPRCPTCGATLEPQAVREDAPLDPRNVYAATKLHQEHLAAAWSRETGVPVTALRYHNVYGPRMPRDTPYAGVAAIFRSAIEAGRAPRVFEDGGQLRDFVHVRDVARANLLALTGERPVAGAFNVCSGTPRSVGQMATALAAAAGGGGRQPVVTGEYRLGDVRHVFAAPERAAEVLGFVAREPFAAGIAEFAAAPLRAVAPIAAG